MRPCRLFGDPAFDGAEVCFPKILKGLLDSQIFGAGRHLFVDLPLDLQYYLKSHIMDLAYPNLLGKKGYVVVVVVVVTLWTFLWLIPQANYIAFHIIVAYWHGTN